MTQQGTAIPTAVVEVQLPVLVQLLGLAYRTQALAAHQTIVVQPITVLVPQTPGKTGS
jgi:hypothetical protein